MAVVTIQQSVAALYVAVFNRAPDQAGLNAWTNAITSGQSTFAQVAAGFAAHEVFTTGIGALSNTAYVAALYTNILGSAGDAAGIANWTAQLNAGQSKAAVAALFVQAALTVDIPAMLAAGSLTAAEAAAATVRQDTLTNKANTGIYFAETLKAASNLNPLTVQSSKAGLEADPIYNASKAAIANVTNTAASVQSAKDAISVAAGIANPAQSLLGGTFTLTTALGEQINGTAGNDTINAVLSSVAGSSTLNVGDLIDGKAGTDTLKLIVDTAAPVALPVGLQVNNVENIAITNGGSLAAAIDASAFVGAANIKQIASAQTVQKLGATTTAAFQNLETGGLTVTADAAAASANVALDNVKSTGVGNVVTLGVSADAANTALAAVNVSGNIVQKDATQAANAKAEVQTVDFAGTTCTDGDITVGGITVAVLAADTAAEVAGKVQAAINAQTLTAPASGGAVTASVSGSVVTVTFPAGTNVGGIAVANAGSTITGTPTVTEVTAGAAAVAAASAASLALNVDLGKDVQSATVNTAVKSTLTIENAAGSTKNLTSVDASASAGDITYTSADAQVATIKTGAGKDTVTLATALDATTKAASVATGAGDDVLNVTAAAAAAVTGGTTVSVDAGEGKDTINLTIGANTAYDVKAGAGDDTVVITGVVKTTDKIDGGDGVDTVSIAGKINYLADDYIVVNKVLTNFETLKLTGAAVTDLDAAKLAANYTTLDLSAGSTVDNVGTQALVANGALNAEAAGYINVGEGTPAATAITYAGTLNITDKGLAGAADAIKAHAETVNLTIEGGKANGVLANNAVLTGEAKTVNVTLSAGTDTKSTATDTSDDTLVASQVTVVQGTAVDTLKDLTSLTLSGNGKAIVNIGAAAAADSNLVSVDASALNSVNEKGAAAAGLVYTSFNSKAETIKLGAGLDTVTLNASTYGKVDTITGLNLVLNSAKTAVDTTKGDSLIIGNFGDLTAGGKMTTTQTDLDLALKDAAAYQVNGANVDQVAFHFGGDTYLFSDKGTNGSLDALDIVVKLVGTVDLDTLVVAV